MQIVNGIRTKLAASLIIVAVVAEYEYVPAFNRVEMRQHIPACY